VNQIYQGNCFRPGADPTVPGFDPLLEVLHYYGFHVGEDAVNSRTLPTARTGSGGPAAGAAA